MFRLPRASHALFIARASSEMPVATRSMRSASNVAARAIAWGKTVARPARATPCSASFHHGNRGMPSRSTGSARSIISETFSSRVSRPTRSSIRFSTGRSGLRKGRSAGACARTPRGSATARARGARRARARRGVMVFLRWRRDHTAGNRRASTKRRLELSGRRGPRPSRSRSRARPSTPRPSPRGARSTRRGRRRGARCGSGRRPPGRRRGGVRGTRATAIASSTLLCRGGLRAAGR